METFILLANRKQGKRELVAVCTSGTRCEEMAALVTICGESLGFD